MAFVFTWASANSHTSRGASEHSAAQSRKLERNPCGTAPIPSFRTIAGIATSGSGRPFAEGNTSPEPSANSRDSRSTARARVDSGTRCSRFVFIRPAGMRHSRASRSISFHSAPRTSPLRHAVSTRNSNASAVAGSAPDPRTLVVQVWDASQAEAVDKAIRDSGLGLATNMEGSTIRINIPPLSEERRAELAKLSAKYAEAARVAVRNIRRDGIEGLRKQEKDGEIGQDLHRRQAEQIQKLTDATIAKIDEMLANKEKDIMAV